ncbi:hypothetical protein [Clostridium culturomicium]|uniref:hypothetical protein n=1 Tax=Clostridium culturomicium TaxID=1499683 RepID=UPI003857A822
MDNNINSPNSLWSALKEGIIFVIKSETSSIDAILNLIFGILAILFVFAYAASPAVEILLKFLKPEFTFGVHPIYVILMFYGVLLYFGKCIKFVNEQKSKEAEIQRIKKAG